MSFDPGLYAIFRVGFAVLTLIDLASYWPFRNRIFGPAFDERAIFATGLRRHLFLGGWLLCSLGLLLDVATLAAAVGAAFCCRVAYVGARQANLMRGGGAVGLMPWFSAVYLVLFEGATWAFGPVSAVHETILDVARTHSGVILFCAGLCKVTSGYLRGEGLEYAIVNPFWSWHWRWVRRIPPAAWWIWPVNLAAGVGELVMGTALVVPATAPLGALLCAVGYLGLFLMLKLLTLPLLFALLGVLFLAPLVVTGPFAGIDAAGALPGDWQAPVSLALWAVLGVLIATKLVQWSNYYLRWTGPAALQQAVEWVGLKAPELIWRVFTPDLIDFFVRIRAVGADGARTLFHEDEALVDAPGRGWAALRFRHPAELIALSSLFTPLKYGPGQEARFRRRLIAYGRSLLEQVEKPPDTWRYEYMGIEKTDTGFRYVHAGTIEHDLVDDAIRVSPVPGAESVFARTFSPFVGDFGRFGNYVREDESDRA